MKTKMKRIKAVFPPGVAFPVAVQKAVRDAGVRVEGSLVFPFFEVIKVALKNVSNFRIA